MIGVKAPQTELEWSRRAIINVVDVLAVHAESLTLIGAHAVLLRTMDLDVPRMPTGDGDLGVTPGLVGDLPSIEALLADAGYEHRTTPVLGCGVESRTTSRTARDPSARRSTCSRHMGSQVRPVAPSAAFRRFNRRTASSQWAMLSASSSPHSTDRWSRLPTSLTHDCRLRSTSPRFPR